MPTKAYAAQTPNTPLAPFTIDRRTPGPDDVHIDIKYCGVCHSDIHQARDEWGRSIFPMVPGHEIIGTVKQTGKNVKKFKPGDTVGVGCMVNSCKDCRSCREHLEQFCENGGVYTYNSTEKDGTPTYGGYSKDIVVNQDFVLTISPKLPLDGAAPLLCAGITMYSPLKHWKVQKGTKVGIMGLGGLGHMGVKLAHAMEAEVTVISSTEKKRNDAERLGAKNYIVSKDEKAMENAAGYFDIILNTISSTQGLTQALSLVRRDGTMVLLGVPDKPEEFHPAPLIMKRRTLAGSLIGGIKETQEMLDFCAEHGITSDIELIPINYINEAYERMIKGDVRYRFVIDINSL